MGRAIAAVKSIATLPDRSEEDAGQGARDAQMIVARAPSDLYIYASIREDIQKRRMATMNQFRSMYLPLIPAEKRAKVKDRKSAERALPDPVLWKMMTEHQRALVEATCDEPEKRAEATLIDELRKHPLGEWAGQQYGIGYGTNIAMALARIGDFSRFPNVGKLWAVAGYAGKDWRRGGKYDHRLRTYMWRISERVKQTPRSRGSFWRGVYDARKALLEARTTACDKCSEYGGGQSRHDVQVRIAPAARCSQSHLDKMAMAYVAKEILKAMWVEAKRLGLVGDHEYVETHSADAPDNIVPLRGRGQISREAQV